MELEEMKVRVEEMMDEISERNCTCLNDGFNFNNLTAMLTVVENQLAGKTSAGYEIKYGGKVFYANYPHAKEEVLRFFPSMIKAYEREV
jgi:hypothetical protein